MILSENTSKICDISSCRDILNFTPFIYLIREQQIQRMKSENYFGTLTEISRSDFLVEVTEASKKHPVIVYLYQTR